MMQNNMGMYNNMGMGGTMYGNVAPVKMTQALTPEEIKQLQKNNSAFVATVTEEEKLEAYCTHKNVNNTIAAEYNEATGMYYCPICKQHFAALDISAEEAEQIVENFVALLQNIKLNYFDIPVGFVRQFFNILPLARKVPALYKIALKNFRDHETYNGINQTTNMYGASMLNSIMNPGMMMGNPGVAMGQNLMNPAMMNQQQAMMGGMNPQMMGGANPAMMGGMNPQMMGANPAMMGGMNPQMMGGCDPMMMDGQAQNGGNPFTTGGVNPVGQSPTQNNNQGQGKNIEHKSQSFNL